MSGHSKWSEIRRQKGAPDPASERGRLERERFERELKEDIATEAERLRDALGLPADLSIEYSTKKLDDRLP